MQQRTRQWMDARLGRHLHAPVSVFGQGERHKINNLADGETEGFHVLPGEIEQMTHIANAGTRV